MYVRTGATVSANNQEEGSFHHLSLLSNSRDSEQFIQGELGSFVLRFRVFAFASAAHKARPPPLARDRRIASNTKKRTFSVTRCKTLGVELFNVWTRETSIFSDIFSLKSVLLFRFVWPSERFFFRRDSHKVWRRRERTSRRAFQPPRKKVIPDFNSSCFFCLSNWRIHTDSDQRRGKIAGEEEEDFLPFLCCAEKKKDKRLVPFLPSLCLGVGVPLCPALLNASRRRSPCRSRRRRRGRRREAATGASDVFVVRESDFFTKGIVDRDHNRRQQIHSAWDSTDWLSVRSSS